MAALTSKRAVRIRTFRTKSLLATTDYYYQGAAVGFDTATGKLIVAQASTTFQPIGLVKEDTDLTGGDGQLIVELLVEVRAVWFANSGSDAVDANDIGKLCYFEDDQTVAETDATNTLSVAGRVWDVDSAKGVLVELMATAGQRTNSGLDA